MSFSYSAGVITQTGTDTDLSGLTGLTGVTVISHSSRYAIYDIGTNRLDIGGNLTINPEENMFISNAATGFIPDMSLNVRNGATLTLGVKTTVGTANKYTTGTAFILAEPGNLNTDGSFHVESGATLESYGATIQMAGPTRIRAGATLTVEDLTVVNCRNGACQFRIEAVSVADVALVSINENGMTLNGVTSSDSCRLTTIGNVNPFNPNAFIFNFVRAQYQPASNGYPSQVFLNFDNGNNIDSADFAYAGSGGSLSTQFNGNLVDFRNVARRLRYTNANNKGGFSQITKVVNFNLLTQSGAALSGVSYYSVDVDNGNRINFNGFNSTADIVYQGQNVGPSIEVIPIIEFMAGENTTRFIDDRTNSDTLTFKFVSYLTSIAVNSPNLIGLKTLFVDVVNADDTSITETIRATVDAYTTLETSAKLYDRAKSYLVTNYIGELQTTLARSGNQIDAGAYNVTIDATASSVFDITGNLITIKASTFTGDMVTTGLITLANGATFDGVRTDANGTVYPDQPISITNISAGSQMRIYNVTTGTEIVNTVVFGTSYTSSYQEGTGYNDGDTVRVYLTKLGKKEWVGDVIDTSNGFSVLAAQVDDDVYVALGIDGSTITKFQADYPNNEVDLIIGSDWTMAELYAWWANNLTTEDGIRNFFGGITAIDEANFKINTAIVDLFLDNTTNASYKQTDNRRFFRDTGTGYPVRNPTTSGYGLDVVWRNTILIAQTAGGTSDLSFVDVKRAVRQALSPKDKAVIIKKAR